MENGRNHGKCFFYDHGELSYISVWEHDKEIETTHIFDGNTLTIYKDGKIDYQGNYVMTSEFEFYPKPSLEIDYHHFSHLSQQDIGGEFSITKDDYSCCCITAAVSFCLFLVEGAIEYVFNVTESEAGYFFALLSLGTFLVFVISCCCCGSTSNK